ncbi:hypothetical protein EJB05_28048, partial [Eragrostis curvula]
LDRRKSFRPLYIIIPQGSPPPQSPILANLVAPQLELGFRPPPSPATDPIRPDPPTPMAAEGEKKMITLKSSDGEEFEVEEAVAMESQTIRHMIEDDCADNGIPLPNVNSKILSKVIEYCNKHVHAAAAAAKAGSDDAGANNSSASTTAASGEDLKNWDADFVKVDQATLFDLILAANYLNIKGLLDLTCQTVADMIKGKTPEEIRKTFNIKNDFTPEEEEEIRRENQWAFE